MPTHFYKKTSLYYYTIKGNKEGEKITTILKEKTKYKRSPVLVFGFFSSSSTHFK
ncbi:hypothetical protein JCM19045_4345 [Bacillus sp. JCM 19045]|nr:hypothetical protein JCM19045_4345 [Bacillus sp. JCM 19045]